MGEVAGCARIPAIEDGMAWAPGGTFRLGSNRHHSLDAVFRCTQMVLWPK
jgi:hypothetical protein